MDRESGQSGKVKKMGLVYLVTEGEYDGYNVNAVFSTEALAKEYIDHITGNGKVANSRFRFHIEPRELDKPLPKMYVGWRVSMNKKGKLQYASYKVFEFMPDPILWADNSFINGWVETEDSDIAIKTMNQRRLKVIALGLWGNRNAIQELFATHEKAEKR